VSDISEQGHIDERDQHWMFNTIVPAAAKNGLKRITSIQSNAGDAKVAAYLAAIETNLSKFGIRYRAFSTPAESTEWIQLENERSNILLHDRPVDTV
jgi:hypothetical protein